MDKGNQPLLLWHKDDPHSGLEIRKGGLLYKLGLLATERENATNREKKKKEKAGGNISDVNTSHLITIVLIVCSFNQLLITSSNIAGFLF